MVVVDAVRPVVFDVPAEGAEAHPDIDPRDHHPRDVVVNVREDGLSEHLKCGGFSINWN